MSVLLVVTLDHIPVVLRWTVIMSALDGVGFFFQSTTPLFTAREVIHCLEKCPRVSFSGPEHL